MKKRIKNKWSEEKPSTLYGGKFGIKIVHLLRGVRIHRYWVEEFNPYYMTHNQSDSIF